MPTTDQPAKAGSDQAKSVWEQALTSEAAQAYDKALANQDGGTPEEASAESEKQPTATPAKETPKAAAPATEPAATKDAATEEPEGGAQSGLDGIPAEYREVVAAALEQRKRELQNGYLKKFDALSAQKKELEGLLETQKALGLSPQEIADYAQAFKDLKAAPGVRITQGTKVLYEAADAAQHDEPDYDSMTKAEIAAHFRKEVENAKKAAVEAAQKSVAPVLEQTQAAEAKQKVVEWRAARRDIADDEMALAVALAQKFEQEVLPKGLDAVDAYMQPFVALARSLKTQATATPAPRTAPKTEVPSRETQAPVRKLDSMEAMMEEAARKKGHRSVNDLLRSRKDE
jgi:hypothetical protein